ncbi:MAG: XRE family transcriptional regulator [Cyanobacteriota bacterium]
MYSSIENRTILGKRIRIIREKLSMNRDVFAEWVNICPRTLSDYESGRTNIKPTFLFKLIEKSNVNINWLFSGIGKLFNKTINNNKNKWVTVKRLSEITGVPERTIHYRCQIDRYVSRKSLNNLSEVLLSSLEEDLQEIYSKINVQLESIKVK